MTRLSEGIRAAGVDPVHCGLMALESLRLEKGYRDFAVDIDNTDTPLQAGLGFVVDFTKPDFIGREALLRAEGRRPPDPAHRAVPAGRSRTAALGQRTRSSAMERDVGIIRAGAFGPTLGCSVGLGAIEHADGITADFLRAHRWEIDVHDHRIPATPSLTPFYDPKSERIRA